MSPPDDDRAAILRRRAFFVRSALTATLGATQVGCPQEKPAPETVTVLPDAPPPTAAPTASAPPPAPEPAVELPPLDVPTDVSAEARVHFEKLARDVPAIHAELADASKTLAERCPIDDAACDAHWEAIAKHLAEAKDALADLGPRCPGSSDDAKRFDERLALHANVIRARIDRLENRVASQLADAAAKKRWAEHQEASAIPRPCLKFACEDW